MQRCATAGGFSPYGAHVFPIGTATAIHTLARTISREVNLVIVSYDFVVLASKQLNGHPRLPQAITGSERGWGNRGHA